jgi:hypothetical protein
MSATQDEFLWWGTALNYPLHKPVNCFPSLGVVAIYLGFVGSMYTLFALGVKLPLDKIVR